MRISANDPQIIKALERLLSLCKPVCTEEMMKTYDFVYDIFSMSAVGLKVISNSNFLVPAKVILNTLLLSHFLSNILEIFMSLLVLRRKPQGLSYLPDAF